MTSPVATPGPPVILDAWANGHVRHAQIGIDPAAPNREAWADFASEWNHLPVDENLGADRGFRRRRYGRAVVGDGRSSGSALRWLPHRPFCQAADHVVAYGGRERHFPPLTPSLRRSEVLRRLVHLDVDLFGLDERPVDGGWEVGIHAIRTTTAPDCIGLPTPEGRHRDGHRNVAVHLIDRRCEGGTTLVYLPGSEAPVAVLTLLEPLETLLLDDEFVEHEVTPVTADRTGYRDVLLVAFYAADPTET